MSARRTQEERSAATRGLLVDAAIDSLVERGWAGTTAVEVCARAGVTRGAMVHHFPSLGALLATALGTFYAQTAPGDDEVPTTLAELVDATWERVSFPRFKAVLEAWLASANDPTLHADLVTVMLDFAKRVSADELAGHGLLVGADARTFFLLAREAMLGLAVGRATNGGEPLGHEQAVLDLLRTQARALDERTA